MQPDSVTQVLGLLLVQLGIPAPFAALIALLSLFMVPALIVGVVDVQMARAKRRRMRKAAVALLASSTVAVSVRASGR